MSLETEQDTSARGAVIDALRVQLFEEKIARVNDRFLSNARLDAERDRRYAEVNTEREKALKIKEQADRDALSLAREIQTYKDEKANELREQISRERGLYVTQPEFKAMEEKILATIAPLVSYAATQQGSSTGRRDFWGYIVGGIGLLVLIYKVLRP